MSKIHLYLCLMIFILIGVVDANAQTITSTTNGGNWNNAATWIGGVVPGAGSDVVINGPVDATNGAVCHNITINAGVVLQNVNAAATLTINGHVLNNGDIRLNPSGMPFTLHILGNITNNGVWQPHTTRLTGSGIQTLAQASGRSFEGTEFQVADTLGVIAAASDLTFRTKTRFVSSGHWATFDLQHHALTLDGAANGFLTGAKMINTASITFANNARLETSSCAGQPHLYGLALIGGGVSFSNTVTVEDTLQDTAPNVHIAMNHVVNNGVIQPNYSLYLHITGNITNNGLWLPTETLLEGEQDQLLSQTAGTWFDGNNFKNLNEQGIIQAGSDLTFRTKTYFYSSTFDLQHHALTLDGENLTAANMINTASITFANNAWLETSSCAGEVHLHGLARIGGGVSFSNTVTVEDTLQDIAPNVHVTMNDVVNNGVIQQNYSLYLHIAGNITNNGEWSTNYIYLTGIGPRTIMIPDVQSTVSVTGPDVVFINDNVVPNLGINIASHCRLASLATLTVQSGVISGILYNWGEISLAKPITTASNYPFWELSGQLPAGSGLDTLTVKSFGHQAPQTFASAVRSWWRVIPSPETVETTFANLTLHYDDDILGQNDEAELKVFHSRDDGATWELISTDTNTTQNMSAKTITITDAPAYGDFLLSSTLHPVTVRPSVIPSIIGRQHIRVGPPNRYTIHYVNNSDTPTGDLAIMLEMTPGIHIQRIEPSAPPGVTAQPILPEHFALVWDSLATPYPDTLALLFVESMAPREERTFTIILDVELDPDGYWTNPHGERVLPVLVAYAGYAVAGLAISFTSDLVQNAVEVAYGSGDTTAGEVFDEAWQRTTDEWFGYEKPAKEVLKKFAYTWGPGLVLGPGVVFLEVAEFGVFTIRAMFVGANQYLNGDVNQTRKNVVKVSSWDPNEKAGPAGFNELGYITSVGRMNYQIFFENLAQATAPAYQIVIVDTLRAEFDPATVEFGPVSHDGFSMTQNGNILRWEAVGIELPPNINPPEGEGWVSYSVLPYSDLPSGSTLPNTATIVFDVNPPIMTNEVVNTLDFLPPVTTMLPLPATITDSTVVVRWQSQDDAAGVHTVTVYAARDNGGFYPVGTVVGDSLLIPVQGDHDYAFYALAKDFVGNVEFVAPAAVEVHVNPLRVEDEEVAGYSFALSQNYPNPFNPATVIQYSLPKKGPVSLMVYNIAGQRVAVLVEEEQPAGSYQVAWQPDKSASGVYFYQLKQESAAQVRKMIYLK